MNIIYLLAAKEKNWWQLQRIDGAEKNVCSLKQPGCPFVNESKRLPTKMDL